MRLGEIVETLIQLRNEYRLTFEEDEAVCAACNILDRLPGMMDEDAAKAILQKKEKQTA
mgnify:CR=1 FL=1